MSELTDLKAEADRIEGKLNQASGFLRKLKGRIKFLDGFVGVDSSEAPEVEASPYVADTPRPKRTASRFADEWPADVVLDVTPDRAVVFARQRRDGEGV